MATTTTTVAIAGGTGGVGRTIAEGILREASTFRVIILTRRKPGQLPAFNLVEYVQVDYDDVPSLSAELDRQGVTTVICTIGMYGEDRSVAQRNLIEAAERSRTVERFMPSEFTYLTSEENGHLDPGVEWHLQAGALLKASRLKYTRVNCGAFMDFLGMPHVPSNLEPLLMAIDIQNCEAAIPGDGNDPVSMSWSNDAATMVAKLLSVDADEWTEFSNCATDDITFNDIVRIAEEVRGRKFRVRYSSPEDVLQGKMEVLPAPKGSRIKEKDLRDFNILAGHLIVSAAARLDKSTRLSTTFPGFHAKTVREFITEAWEGRS